MNRVWIIVLSVALALTLLAYGVARTIATSDGDRTPGSSAGEIAQPPESSTNSAPAVIPPVARESGRRLAPSTLEEAEVALASALAEHEEAAAALSIAERELDDLEREIDAVERFVQDLKERGEDPARHAEEGMRRLDPVIVRYEARLKTVEACDDREALARLRLEAARSDLERLKR